MNSTQVINRTQPPKLVKTLAGTLCPEDQLLRLTADEIASLLATPANAPTYPPHINLWTWLVGRFRFLHSWRSTQDIPNRPTITDTDRAKLLLILCDQETREAVLSLLSQGIRLITRDELAGGGDR